MVLLTFYSCTPYIYWVKDNHYVTSKVNKNIQVQIVINDWSYGKDSIIYNVDNLCNDSLIKTYLSNSHSSIEPTRVFYDTCIIYNKTDTTSIGDYYYIYAPGNSSKYVTKKYEGIFQDSNNKRTYETSSFHLEINDSLLFLMKKDYTMLEKFKEYYKK